MRGAAQFLKQLSGAVRPRPHLRPSPRGARSIGTLGLNGGRSGDPFPFILVPPRPGPRVRVPATPAPAPAFWLQEVWRGGLEAAGMLIPRVGGASLEKGKRDGGARGHCVPSPRGSR